MNKDALVNGLAALGYVHNGSNKTLTRHGKEDPAMDRAKIIQVVQEWLARYNFHRYHVVLTCGAASVMQGLRETTNDIDLDVHEDVWQWFATNRGSRSPEQALLGPMIQLPNRIAIHPRNWKLEMVKDNTMPDMLYDSIYTMLVRRTKLAYHPDRERSKQAQDLRELIELHRRWYNMSGQYFNVSEHV